jgi:hypothetical protein
VRKKKLWVVILKRPLLKKKYLQKKFQNDAIVLTVTIFFFGAKIYRQKKKIYYSTPLMGDTGPKTIRPNAVWTAYPIGRATGI